jgi:hypothetical protein
VKRHFFSLAILLACIAVLSSWWLARPWHGELPEPAVVGGPCSSPERDIRALEPGTPVEEVRAYFGGRAVPLPDGAPEPSCIWFACSPNSPTDEHFVTIAFPLEEGTVGRGYVIGPGVPSECESSHLVFVGNRPRIAFAR